MNLGLTDDEAAAFLKKLDGLIDGDRYFLNASETRPELTLNRLPISACERLGSASFMARILACSSSVIGTEVVGAR